MELLDEIKQNPKFRDLMSKHPEYATRLYDKWVDDYIDQWQSFLNEIAKERQFNNLCITDSKCQFRPVALMPPVVHEWIQFLCGNEEGISLKESTRKYLKSHPQYWCKDNIFTRGA